MNNTFQTFKNMVVLLLDSSGSMGHLEDKVVQLFDKQIQILCKQSKDHKQETRVSVYTFDNTVKNIVFDTDVLRVPEIRKFYKTGGSTALIDGALTSIEDLKKIPQIHGSYGVILYVLSDGMGNINNNKAPQLRKVIEGLDDNWTVAFFAPNQAGVNQAEELGFPRGNIQTWDVSEKGMEDVGDVMTKATNTYMENRSKGIRGTKSLFQVDASNLNKTVLKQNLEELKATVDYDIYPVQRDDVIKKFVESWTQTAYRVGSAYFELTKPEVIQAYKQIAIQDKKNGKVYAGDKARQLLGLPSVEIKVKPADYDKFRIFTQSTSINRKLVAGTQLIVMK